ncbi:SAV_2336 N-terminal domain-related protein [Streptomyces sp. NPDC017991]|uniref:SAV_2336 N-terminal domain-related protein n=1 Tax=Streptomyces sp. NPDC017991 TaxID=3365026 RepID=UPI00379DCD42
MRSDPGADGGAGAGAAFLAGVLARASGGPEPTSVELAELLWLATHMPAPETPDPTPRPKPSATTAQPPSATPSPLSGAGNCATSHNEPAPDPPPHSIPDPPDTRVPLRLPGPRTPTPGRAGQDAPSGPYTSLLAPAPPMLPHPLGLQRALRPLKRRVPAPVGQELDEAATAHRIARLGAAPQWWLPVLRPTTERWLTLHLVHDTGPTMPVWRPLVRELHAALAQSGIFRTVELHRLEADGAVCRPGSQESFADGRTVTLLLSDCMGPQWREGPAGTRWYSTLRRWSARMPVALVQPLPERLWRTTALPATTARISAPGPAAPNSSYDVDSYVLDSYALDSYAHEGRPRGLLPLPVLEASAPWLGNWSSLVAGGGRLPGAVALLGPGPPLAPVDERGRSDVERLSAEELLLRFRSVASPEAFRLAGHLAVGPVELPVMRLVQAAVEKNPRPQHLAEVILSGALTAVPGAAGSYVFRPGVRELLRRTLPRSAYGRTSELLARVGALIDERAGLSAGEFRVLAPGGNGAGGGGEEAAGEPFAAVREESVRRMGGPPSKTAAGLVLGRYRLVRPLGRGQEVWQAHDARPGRTVAVHRYTVEPERHERFLQDARALSRVRHKNVVAVHDFGIDDGIPYLVTEFLPGITLAELTALGDYGVPFPTLAPLAHQMVLGLKALHEQAMVHGQLSAFSVLVPADGSFRLARFPLGVPHGADASKDLHDLGELLCVLAGGDPSSPAELPGVPAEFRSPFVEAVDCLLSSDTYTQNVGADLLMPRSFSPVLRDVTATCLRYRLLGPVRIVRGDSLLPDLPLQAQALLCMLLLRHGRFVSHDELAAGLWGTSLPEDPAGTLAVVAAALRDALGPGVLATGAGGHALHTPPTTIDVIRCENLIAEAKYLRDEGSTAGARDAVQQALGLWSGVALSDVPGPAAASARLRLRSLRLTLGVTCAELDLALGRFERASHDLGELLREHPEHEDLRRLHMLCSARLTPESEPQPTTPRPTHPPEATPPPETTPQPKTTPQPETASPTGPRSPAETVSPPETTSPAESASPTGARSPAETASAIETTSPTETTPPAETASRTGTTSPAESASAAQTPSPPKSASASETPRPSESADRSETTREAESPRRSETTREAETPRRSETTREAETPRRSETTREADTPRRSETTREADTPRRSETTREADTPRRSETTREADTPRRPKTPLSPPARQPASGRKPDTPRQAAAARQVGSAARRPEDAAAALMESPCVLLGFDGPLVRLYTSDTEKQAVRELAALLAELRDPEAALRGEPLVARGGPPQPLEGRPNPLDLLRAFADHPLGADLRRRLNRIEERAVSTAASTPFSDALITTLSSLGRRTAVVADNAPGAVWKYLHSHGRLTGLVTGGVHGRADDLTLLMPNPDCLLRALEHLGVPPKDAVLVGSSVAELTAARAAGLRFLGYTRSEGHKRRLVRAGCEVTTASWAPLLRSLPHT